MSKIRRRVWAFLVLVGILFSQGALAAYACPALLAGVGAAVPCEQMDMDSAPLCHGHCTNEKQKPHESSQAVVEMQFLAAFCIPLAEPTDIDSWAAAIGPAQRTSHPPPPRNCCLRI